MWRTERSRIIEGNRIRLRDRVSHLAMGAGARVESSV